MIEGGSLYVYTWFRNVPLTWSSCNMVLLLIHAFERTHTLNATANPFKLYALVKSFFLSCSGRKLTGGDGSRLVARLSAHSLWRRAPTMTGRLYGHTCDWPKLYDWVKLKFNCMILIKICMETQKTLNSQSSLEGKKRSWRNQTPWLQSLLQSYSHQDNMVLAQKQKYRSMEQDRKPRDKPMHFN